MQPRRADSCNKRNGLIPTWGAISACNSLTTSIPLDNLRSRMMTVSAQYHARTGPGGATWPLALILGVSIASLTQFASAAPITQPAEASSTVGGEADTEISPEDEPDANLVPTDTDP